MSPSPLRRLLALAPLVLALCAARPAAAHDWNEAIAWKELDAGLEAAKKEHKPVLLVAFTEWCPHCKNYAGVFHDPKVVEKAKRFVMIHLDTDKVPTANQKYAPDGGYIPRTLFLKSDGSIATDIKARTDKFLYFYDEKNPAPLLAAMDKALEQLK